MNDLTNLLKLSIEREAQRQALKTYNALAAQVLSTLKPGPNCNELIAMEFQVEREIWESALAAGERALKGLAAETIPAPEYIPYFTCNTCKLPVPSTINGDCWACYELLDLAVRCGYQARSVLQMPKKARTQ